MGSSDREKLKEIQSGHLAALSELDHQLAERDESGSYLLKTGSYPRKKVLRKRKEIDAILAKLHEKLLTPEGRKLKDETARAEADGKMELERRRELRREELSKVRIIPSRTCFTCVYKRRKIRSSFIVCEHNNEGKPIWEKLHCLKWGITGRRNRRDEIQDLIIGEIPEYDYYYRKDRKEGVPIKLGHCCFTCRFRTGNVKNGFVECTRFLQPVWELAYCRLYRPITDHYVLIQFKKYIVSRSGLDFRKTMRWDR